MPNKTWITTTRPQLGMRKESLKRAVPLEKTSQAKAKAIATTLKKQLTATDTIETTRGGPMEAVRAKDVGMLPQK